MRNRFAPKSLVAWKKWQVKQTVKAYLQNEQYIFIFLFINNLMLKNTGCSEIHSGYCTQPQFCK